MGLCFSKPAEARYASPKANEKEPPEVAPRQQGPTTDAAKSVDISIALPPPATNNESIPAGAPPTELIGNLIDPINGGNDERFLLEAQILSIASDYAPYTASLQAPLVAYPTRFTTLGLLGLPARFVTDDEFSSPSPLTTCRLIISQAERLATVKAIGRIDDPEEDPEILK